MTSAERRSVVVLQVFSGRPDPSWPLEGETLERVVERVRSLREPSREVEVPHPVLGYRGFRITSPPTSELPPSLTVWRGLVTVTRAGRKEVWRDHHDLERLLLDDARRHGHEELLIHANAPIEPA